MCRQSNLCYSLNPQETFTVLWNTYSYKAIFFFFIFFLQIADFDL